MRVGQVKCAEPDGVPDPQVFVEELDLGQEPAARGRPRRGLTNAEHEADGKRGQPGPDTPKLPSRDSVGTALGGCFVNFRNGSTADSGGGFKKMSALHM